MELTITVSFDGSQITYGGGVGGVPSQFFSDTDGDIDLIGKEGIYKIRFVRDPSQADSWEFVSFDWVADTNSVSGVQDGPVLTSLVFADEIVVKNKLILNGDYKYSVTLQTTAPGIEQSFVSDPMIRNRRQPGILRHVGS